MENILPHYLVHGAHLPEVSIYPGQIIYKHTPPRDSKAWEKEYGARTSVERSNKREKEDYKLEDGRHRSTKMWYCRPYGIMMLQHLDAWEMPSLEAFQKSLLGFAD